MTAYYNEIEPYAAEWLRNLIVAGLIAPGDVDTRSIEDVRPDDVRGYEQCHFFAGIGGWSYALRLAGIPDDRRIWTGSCPCQPFSAAGKGAGFADERHLWPAFFHLIRECRPERVVGEQVASNLAWLDLVQGDLEGEGYAVGSAIVGAHSVGAPHIRQRLYWVADDDGQRCALERRGGLLDGERQALGHDADGCGQDDWLGHGNLEGLEGWGVRGGERASELAPWAASVLIPCSDGRWRPVPTESGLQPLVDGSSADLAYHRAGVLKGIGNAIVPQVAAAVLKALP